MTRASDAEPSRSAAEARADAPRAVALAVAAACVGAGTGLALAALQLVSAAAARMLWTLDAPALGLLAYPLAGAFAAPMAVPALLVLRRAVAPRADVLAWVCGFTALGASAGRALASAALRGRQGLPGGRPLALLLVAAALLLLALLVARTFARRRVADLAAGGARATSADRRVVLGAIVVGTGALAGAALVHLVLLAVKDEAARRGLLGAPALLLLAGGSACGALLGLLATSRTRARPPAWLLLVGGVAAGVLAQRAGEPPARAAVEARGPNVLLVVLDTLRRDAVSAHGRVVDTTPRLDELAARGVLCEDALAPGDWTVPSHASLFTGALPSRHGAGHARRVLRATPARGAPPLPTLAELFAGRGWETAAFVCNMNVSRAAGFARGFDAYEEVWRARQGDYDLLGPALRAWTGSGGPFDKGGELAVRGVRDWLAARADARRPWLLFVNLMESHAPYDAPDAFLRRFAPDAPSPAAAALLDDPLAHTWDAGVPPDVADELWARYLAAVAYQDALLGGILDALAASGRADDTLVVVTSDHGEHFGDHGLLGHGQDLDDDLLRVPLVFAGPGVPRGAREAAPTSLLDVLPTLLARTGAPPLPPDAGRPGVALHLDGGDAAALATRERVVERFPLFVDAPGDDDALPPGGDREWLWGRAALVRGDDLLVAIEAPDGEPLRRGRVRLERRVREPAPPRDDGRRVVDDPARAAELLAALAALRAGWTSAETPADAPAPDADVEAALRALGYVGR